jgi:tetratricopeptide (TPR) repeat protein
LVLAACGSKDRAAPPAPSPGPPPKVAAPDASASLIFRDSSGRELTKDDLKNVTGTVDWSVVGNADVSDAAATLFDKARDIASKGDYTAAIALFNKAHDAAPTWPYPLYELAYTYELMDKPSKALAVYEQVVKLAPRGYFTALASVDCLRREAANEWPAGACKRYALAEFVDPAKRTAELSAIVKVAPGIAAAWKDLALDVEGDDAAKLAALDKVLAHEPDLETRGVVLSNKALVLDRLGRRPEAIAILGELALDPRTPLDVEQLSKLALAQMTSADDADKDPPATEDDRKLLARADQILATETVWNRNDTRDCPAGETRWSLFCALHDACVEVLGKYDHRRAALQQVRFVVDERKRDYEHRLMGFNNDPATTFADIKAVLREAEQRIDQRLTKSPN